MAVVDADGSGWSSVGRWCGSVDNGDVDDDGCDGESDSCSVKREGWETDRQKERGRGW